MRIVPDFSACSDDDGLVDGGRGVDVDVWIIRFFDVRID